MDFVQFGDYAEFTPIGTGEFRIKKGRMDFGRFVRRLMLIKIRGEPASKDNNDLFYALHHLMDGNSPKSR
jgi:hypothetical protein